MFKVKFNGVEVFTSEKDVEAVQFALAIHQSSNISHDIEVIWSAQVLPVEDQVVCLLRLDPNKFKK